MRIFLILGLLLTLFVVFFNGVNDPVQALSCSWKNGQCVNAFGGTACTSSDGTNNGYCSGTSAATCKCKDSYAHEEEEVLEQ